MMQLKNNFLHLEEKNKKGATTQVAPKKYHEQSLYAFLFLMPVLILFISFIVFPIIFNTGISFFKWSGVGELKFSGLTNYIRFFTDDSRVGLVFKNVLLFLVISMPVTLGTGLVIAYILNMRIKFTMLYRLVIFMPAVIPGVVVAFIFGDILQPEKGIVNTIIRKIGFELSPNWLGEPKLVIFTIICIWGFVYLGYSMTIYLGGLQNVSNEIIEAAKIDGAGTFRIFFNIIVPMLRSSHIICITLSVLGIFRAFDLIWILTKGGPAGYSEVPASFIYRVAMLDNQMGYAGVVAVIVFLLSILLIIFLQFIFRRIWKY